MAQINQGHERMVHIRVEGRSWQVPAAELGLGATQDETAVKASVARYLDIAPDALGPYVVEWLPGGNITVRPEAVFG
jgi:hypothetical protein